MTLKVGDLVHRLNLTMGDGTYTPNIHTFKIVAIDGEEAWIRGAEDYSRYVSEIFKLKRLMSREDYEKEEKTEKVYRIEVERDS